MDAKGWKAFTYLINNNAPPCGALLLMIVDRLNYIFKP